MLLGFKPRFVSMIIDGSKTHTIRAKRKKQPTVGETCHCYTGLRQKGARLLGRWPCVKVEDIKIYECADGRFSVWIGDNELTPDEKDMLAWRDGFRDSGDSPFVQMIRYWIETHGDGSKIEISFVNFPQGEPSTVGISPRRRRSLYKSLSFDGDLIHWKYRPKARGETDAG